MGKPITQEALAQMVVAMLSQRTIPAKDLLEFDREKHGIKNDACDVNASVGLAHLPYDRRDRLIAEVADDALKIWNQIAPRFSETGLFTGLMSTDPWVYRFSNGAEIDLREKKPSTLMKFFKCTLGKAKTRDVCDELTRQLGPLAPQFWPFIRDIFLVELAACDKSLPVKAMPYFAGDGKPTDERYDLASKYSNAWSLMFQGNDHEPKRQFYHSILVLKTALPVEQTEAFDQLKEVIGAAASLPSAIQRQLFVRNVYFHAVWKFLVWGFVMPKSVPEES